MQLAYTWPTPTRPRPIVILAAGDIVRDAHLPAYRKAGFPVRGIYDLDPATAAARAQQAGPGTVAYGSLAEAVADPSVIFDIASPPRVHRQILDHLPDGAAVLIQKPLGHHHDEAKAIAALCQRKGLRAAVNFQLRFSPPMLAIRDFIRRGQLGDLVDIDIRLSLRTPWELFPFLEQLDRVEILVHTVHYLDLIRSLAGDPSGVHARTLRHPARRHLAQTKSSIILDYGDTLRVCLSINHDYPYGGPHEDAIVRIEGTRGCAVARLGLLLDYPRGKPDWLDVIGPDTDGWQRVPFEGSWFPDAFIGTMSNLQRFVSGEDPALISPVSDALRTMAVVEACYRSDASGGTPLPD